MLKKKYREFQEKIRRIKIKIARLLWDKKTQKIQDGNNIIQKYQVKSILIMRDDGKIGDMVVSSFIYREIKKEFPNIKIGVVTRDGAVDIIKDNRYIDKIYEYRKHSGYLKKLAAEIKQEGYDLLIDTSTILREKQMRFINKCCCKINIGVEKKDWKLFDISIQENDNQHITKRFIKILEKLGVKKIDATYDITVKEESLMEVESKIKLEEKIDNISINKRVILNPYAASRRRSFSKENIEKIINLILQYTADELYLLGHGENKKEILEIKKRIDSNKIHYIELNGIEEVIALIKNSDVIISPDTSIVHIGVGLDKRVIAIYRKDRIGNNSILWGPNSSKAIQIFSNENEDDDINDFDIDEVKKIII